MIEGDEQCLQVEKGSSVDQVDVVFKGDVAVENDFEAVDVWGGGQSGVVNSQAVVLGYFGGMIWNRQ